MQFSYVSSHVEEYTLTGALLKFPDNKERPCAPKKIYWVVCRIEIRERSIALFQCLAVRDICWTTTVMPHLHLCSHKFNMVLCLGVTNYCDVWEPDLMLLRLGEGGGHILPSADFCLAVPKLFTVLPCRPSHLILE